MSDIEREIDDALDRLGISRVQFEKQGTENSRWVLAAARGQFVTGNPRVWWLSLRLPFRRIPYAKEQWPGCLMREIPQSAGACWFIAETDEGDDPPVYKVQAKHLPAVLGECSFFEYYLVGEDYAWLLIDTDHNELLFTEQRPPLGGGAP